MEAEHRRLGVQLSSQTKVPGDRRQDMAEPDQQDDVNSIHVQEPDGNTNLVRPWFPCSLKSPREQPPTRTPLHGGDGTAWLSSLHIIINQTHAHPARRGIQIRCSINSNYTRTPDEATPHNCTLPLGVLLPTSKYPHL